MLGLVIDACWLPPGTGGRLSVSIHVGEIVSHAQEIVLPILPCQLIVWHCLQTPESPYPVCSRNKERLVLANVTDEWGKGWVKRRIWQLNQGWATGLEINDFLHQGWDNKVQQEEQQCYPFRKENAFIVVVFFDQNRQRERTCVLADFWKSFVGPFCRRILEIICSHNLILGTEAQMPGPLSQWNNLGGSWASQSNFSHKFVLRW